MGLIGRDNILEAADIDFVEIDIPEWGGTVRLASMNGSSRELFEAAWLRSAGEDDKNLRATLAALSIVDEDGARLFTIDDIELLGEKAYTALDKVFEAAQTLNGMDETPEDAEKN